jgi:hypothetical protein
MNTAELIQQEANNYASGKAINGVDAKIVRKDFIAGATFGASLNGWVSVNDRLPTEDDADEDVLIEVFISGSIHGQYMTIKRIKYYIKVGELTFTHWRKIVKP